MATYIGTAEPDTIQPGFVSPGVDIQGDNSPPDEDDDTIHGLGGDDVLGGGGGDDVLGGGRGNDRLLGNGGADTIVGGTGNDTLRGLRGNDFLFGGSGDDFIYGTLGRDELIGGGGTDFLLGGVGRDRLDGGADFDVLIGGRGDDLFTFTSASHSSSAAPDLITGFEDVPAFEGAGITFVGEPNDKIDLSAIDADVTNSGKDDFVFGGSGTGRLSLVDDGNTTIVRASIDDDRAFELEIAITDGANVVAADYWQGDFILSV